MQKIKNFLSGVYQSKLDEIFALEVPEEKFATCDNCVMVCKDKSKTNLAFKAFEPGLKCCTYHPNLPSYLVGSILSSTEAGLASGRELMARKIEGKIGVTPMGIFAPKLYNLLYRQGHKHGFGTSEKLLCPYYNKENNNCNIWKYREAVCSTFFCRHTTDFKGKELWMSIMNYMKLIERKASEFILLETGFTDIKLIQTYIDSLSNFEEDLTSYDIDEKPMPEEKQKLLWQNWYGRESEFYLQSALLFESLTTDDLIRLLGINHSIMVEEIKKNISKAIYLPEKMEKNKDLEFLKEVKGHYSVLIKNSDQKFHIPTILIDQFDGVKSVANIIKELENAHGIEIDYEYLYTLYSYLILVESKI